ncbi:MAG: hypothetical protein MI974_03675 [Chitinophagales bacterium]|nr:hypothetical protein [Chitinophagales bacterium]
MATNIVDFLMRSPDVEQVEIYFKWSIIAKDGDDKHFNVLKKIGFPPIQLLRTKDFLKEIENLGA